MSLNPLQKYFRQPKIYISLPSKGIYSAAGSIEKLGEQMPVMSMTGMDEILLKTPDALLNGEATVKVIESCCPYIKDAWEVSNLDLDLILISIRIATYGNSMDISSTCPACSSENDYEIDLMRLVDHLTQCKYENKVVVDELTIFIRPLSYRIITDFSIKSFELQKYLQQSLQIENEDERTTALAEMYNKMADSQKESYIASIDSVQAPEGVVDERAYIAEWIQNSEKSMFDAIKEQIDKNNNSWRIPDMEVECKECGHKHATSIQMDQANFFVGA
jgi:rubrerythrin